MSLIAYSVSLSQKRGLLFETQHWERPQNPFQDPSCFRFALKYSHVSYETLIQRVSRCVRTGAFKIVIKEL